MLPELAALVSQKFTFSVSISTKNLTQRNVSFQVNGIVAFFGKQTHIPTTKDMIYDCGTTSPTALAIQTSTAANKNDSAPPKKPRLDRKAIPCRRSLTFDVGHNTGEKTCALGEKDKIEAVAHWHLWNRLICILTMQRLRASLLKCLQQMVLLPPLRKIVKSRRTLKSHAMHSSSRRLVVATKLHPRKSHALDIRAEL